MATRFTTLKQLTADFGISLHRSTIHRLIEKEAFPRPVKLTPGGRRMAWHTADIEKWIASRQPAGRVQRISAADMPAFYDFFRGIVSRIRAAGYRARQVDFEGGAFAAVLATHPETIGFYSPNPDGSRTVLALTFDMFEPFTSGDPDTIELLSPGTAPADVRQAVAKVTARNLVLKGPSGQWHELPPLDVETTSGIVKLYPPKAAK